MFLRWTAETEAIRRVFVMSALPLSFLQSEKKTIPVVRFLTFTVVRLSTAAYYATGTYHFDT